jgi:signal transduction histidine kinase/response regulator RpfG family c-di-GMP phosphodiesterase
MNKLKILAIDDNRDNLTSLKAVVSDKLPGVRVLTALCGSKGIELALAEDPDVILLDIVMPDMDGYAVCGKLKADDRLHTIPVLFLTALRNDRGSRVKALEAGADGFLSKPFDEAELVAQIRAMTKIKAANRLQQLEKEQLAALVLDRTLELEHELAERKRVENALRESESKTRSILDNIGIGIALISSKMEILELNNRIREWFPAIDPGKHPICYRVFSDPPREGVCDSCPTFRTLRDGLVHEGTIQHSLAGSVRSYRIVSSPLFNASGEVTAAIEIAEDITEKRSLESQLQQAQKMESIGRLAGGVAHDYNNMLSVILGFTELAMGKTDPSQPIHADLKEVYKAARRSTEITRQLLAFARKQPIAPEMLDLNGTIEGMLKMLRRLIGEDIDLIWLPQSGLWPIRMDPAQIDQILANLGVNARDAIPDVGKLTIKTENIKVNDASRTDYRGCPPGEYVLMTVTDNGCGMEKETLGRIFEPFFTTKAVGQGTGLGLATVYGIVQQNHGFIDVCSTPGKGTDFKIFLPRHAGAIEIPEESASKIQIGRGETVLLVEDEVSILKMSRIMLEKLNYKVLTAHNPGEAIQLAGEHAGRIHLLLTDVVMPEMNGRDLAERIMAIRPAIKCLFMSGYTADVIANRGVPGKGVRFIQKPFAILDLSIRVRAVIEDADQRSE